MKPTFVVVLAILAVLPTPAVLGLCAKKSPPSTNGNVKQPLNALIKTDALDVNFKFKPAQTAGLDVEIKAATLIPNQEFSYHIHVSPVVAGNCTSTGGHYDPLNVTARGVVPVPGDFSTFEKGDLSGKFGKLKSNAEGKLSEGGKDKYSDPTITLADLTGRSIVIHDAAGKRIGCADLK